MSRIFLWLFGRCIACFSVILSIWYGFRPFNMHDIRPYIMASILYATLLLPPSTILFCIHLTTSNLDSTL